MLHRSQRYHPVIYDKIAKPIVDSRGKELADALAAAFGERVRFACNWAPGAIVNDLAHPDLISNHGIRRQPPAELPAAMLQWVPLFYAIFLLRQALLGYVLGNSVPGSGRRSTCHFIGKRDHRLLR